MPVILTLSSALLGLLSLIGNPLMAAPAAADTELYALFEQTWEEELAMNPLAATYQGDSRFNDRWADRSAAGIAARHTHDRRVLKTLERIPRSTLSSRAQIDYDLFQREYRERLALYPFKPWLYDESISLFIIKFRNSFCRAFNLCTSRLISSSTSLISMSVN